MIMESFEEYYRDMEGIEKVSKENLHYSYSDLGYRYKGYQLEVEVDEDPGERYYYYSFLFDPKGKKIDLPKTKEGGIEQFIDIMGSLRAKKFKAYIDSLI